MTRIMKMVELFQTPWVTLMGKTIINPISNQEEEYYSLLLPDYVAIMAITSDGLIPIIRQYRPAVESYTWEIPAGLREVGEDPFITCQRELLEETGLIVDKIIYSGCHFSDTGRLDNHQHVFIVSSSKSNLEFTSEPGLEVKFVSFSELKKMIWNGSFNHQLHVAVILYYFLIKNGDI